MCLWRGRDGGWRHPPGSAAIGVAFVLGAAEPAVRNAAAGGRTVRRCQRHSRRSGIVCCGWDRCRCFRRCRARSRDRGAGGHIASSRRNRCCYRWRRRAPTSRHQGGRSARRRRGGTGVGDARAVAVGQRQCPPQDAVGLVVLPRIPNCGGQLRSDVQRDKPPRTVRLTLL